MTMSGHVHERLSAYLDRELGTTESAAVAAHLRDCEPCRQHLGALATVDQTARVLTAEAPEGYFDALPGRVRARLEASTGRLRSVPVARRPARLPAWTWALAAALVLAVITPITLLRSRSPATSPEEAVVGAKVAPAPLPMPAATAAPLADGAGRDLATDQLRRDEPALRERSAFAGARAPAPVTPLATPPPEVNDLRLAETPRIVAAAPSAAAPSSAPVPLDGPAPAAEPQRAKPQEKKLGGPGGPYQGQVQTQAQAVQDKDAAYSKAKATPPPPAPVQGGGDAAESVVVTGRSQESDARAGGAARNEAPPPAAAAGGNRAVALPRPPLRRTNAGSAPKRRPFAGS